jgi:hypothetical protein
MRQTLKFTSSIKVRVGLSASWAIFWLRQSLTETILQTLFILDCPE